MTAKISYGKYKSGFVAIIGRPNVGKSSFLNSALGQKIAIMSDKPQTTRNKIHGVVTTDSSQIIFIDTPGVHKPYSKLETYMMKEAYSTLNEVDVVLLMVNAVEAIGKVEQELMKKLATLSTPVILVINKVDLLIDDGVLPAIIETYKRKMLFAEIMTISALYGYNINPLLNLLVNYLPEGPRYYPEEQVTNHPERFIIAEFIREKVCHLTWQEIPHSVAVVIDSLKKTKIVHIIATIWVERNSQKGMIIGKQGLMLKEIGKQAREDIEKLLGSKIYLELWVKVQKDWRNKPAHLREAGLHNE